MTNLGKGHYNQNFMALIISLKTLGWAGWYMGKKTGPSLAQELTSLKAIVAMLEATFLSRYD